MSFDYRMGRTLPTDRAAIIMPIDTGLIFSTLPGLESPSQVAYDWAESDVTGFMMTPGQVAQTAGFFARHGHLTRVLTIDTYYQYSEPSGGAHRLITTVEDAVRMGVDAVKML